MKLFMRRQAASLFAVLLLGCSGDSGRPANAPATSADSGSAAAGAATAPGVDTVGRSILTLASTTSTEDSGLFDVLIPAFEHAHPKFVVRVVAVGSGQALELGRRKDADVLLVHAPAAENEFVSRGFGTRRCLVMYNDFVFVGPPGDPARVKGVRDPLEALRRIRSAGALFVSRGDDSGTHRKEKSLWEEAHLVPRGTWYLEAGQGMGEVLTIASEKSAYTFTDRATYLFLKDRNALEIFVEGDKRLINQYGVIPVTGARNRAGADTFAEWITSPDGQQIIANYGIAKVGQALFVPNAQGCAAATSADGSPSR